MIKRIQIVCLVVIVLFGGGWLFLSQTVYAAATLTVTQDGDLSDLSPGDGLCDTLPAAGHQCSLRAAIEELNAQGPGATPHRIEFNIPGSGPFTIVPGSIFPNITVPVEIDGATQPGASCPTASTPANLLIILDGNNSVSTGLNLNSGSDDSVVRGLVIGNFTGSAISIHSNDNAVRCNHIGVGVDGVTSIPNGSYAVSITGDNNTIGGQAAHARRNVISGNISAIAIHSADNRITNNFIGTTADGLGDLGNGTGIAVAGTASGTIIGGSDSLARNVIAGNSGPGLNLKGTDTFVLGNLIGVGRDGVTALHNVIGITVESSGNTIGGLAPGEGNIIAFNQVYGIRVAASATPIENEIRGNSFHDNIGLAIDLDGNGVDVNDAGDVDTGPNGFQNYPVLNNFSGAFLNGTLDSIANTTYTVDVYRNDSCDPSGYGEGQELVYSSSYTTDAGGSANFSVDTTSWSISPGDYLTALATDPNGNTSEFSTCLLVPAPPPTPTPTATNTPTATATPSPTPTASPTPNSTASPTSTVSPPPTSTASPTATATTPPNFLEWAYISAVFK